MAQLFSQVLTYDEAFRSAMTELLQRSGMPLSLRPPASNEQVDLALVDFRTDSAAALLEVEQLRARSQSTAIFGVGHLADPTLVVNAMRAGANDFLPWPPTEEAFRTALNRAVLRRDTLSGPTHQASLTYAFFGATGGSGTTTLAANCAVQVARLSQRPTIVIDLAGPLGELALFFGNEPELSLSDAVDNLRRLDYAELKRIVLRHKSGVDVLAAPNHFERPRDSEAPAVEELLWWLGHHYAYIILDAGRARHRCGLTAIHAADLSFVVTLPDVPSVRNTTRALVRLRQAGRGMDRVRLVLNRAARTAMISPAQVEAATGCPIAWKFTNDYRTVATALNSGVPLSMTDKSELAQELKRFASQLIESRELASVGAVDTRRARISALF